MESTLFTTPGTVVEEMELSREVDDGSYHLGGGGGGREREREREREIAGE